ncbi:MAG: ATP-binding protein [Deltaproteobacteria bacterium]|nr:ATP-binding protein [Deltaproteobacteria bacterium]
MTEFMENKITDVLIEELLNEEESSSLDFKRNQYPFVGATDDQKSELLKDILAFANAWRRNDSYILVGVEEVKGGRSIVKGVSHHIDDAQLQQFVNHKTQRPLTFSYTAYPFECKQIGIICIPLQQRPFFLKKDFGKLKRNVVHVRRGSSTDIADPDEIARMGSDLSTSMIKDEPLLKVSFWKSDGTTSDHLEVPSIEVLDKEGVLNRIIKLKLTDEVVQLIERYKKELDEIADSYPNGKIYNPYKVDQVYEFNRRIDEAKELVNADFEKFQERFNLSRRSLKLSEPQGPVEEQNFVLFKISNDGRCPAENLIVYITPLNGVSFYTRKDLAALNITIHSQRPKYIEDIIALAYKLDKNDFNTRENLRLRTRNALIKGSYSSAFDYRLVNPGSHQNNVTVERNTLEINLKQDLMHNHYKTMGDEGLYLSPSLQKGEKALIEYKCHANNMPEPSKGFLQVEGI